MIDDECYVTKLNEILKRNSIIIKKNYSLTRKYHKCQREIENSTFILRTQENEWKSLTLKLKTLQNSVDTLTQMINETDLKIERVEGEIFILNEKIGRISNDIMTTTCSLSNDDESKLIQRQMGLVLLNSIKYSKEIQALQYGFDASPDHMDVKQFYETQWSQFRMEQS